MPLVTLVLAQTPYQTLVVTAGLAAVLVLASVLAVPLLAGTPAKVVEGIATLLCALVGPAPKPPRLSTR